MLYLLLKVKKKKAIGLDWGDAPNHPINPSFGKTKLFKNPSIIDK